MLHFRVLRYTHFIVLLAVTLLILASNGPSLVAQSEATVEVESATSEVPTSEPTLAEMTTVLTSEALSTPTATSDSTATETVTAAPSATAEIEITPEVTPETTLEATVEITTIPSVTLATETATIEATATLSPEPPLTLLYSDNFDTGQLYTWTLGSGWSLVSSEGGQSLQATNTEEPVTFLYDNLYNVVIQARFQLTSGSAQISSRQSSVGSYTAALKTDGTIELYRAGILLTSAITAPVQLGDWRTLRLSAIDGNLRVSVDGVEVITWYDSAPLPPGGLNFSGKELGQSTLTVDDFELWTVSETLPITPTPTPDILPVEPELGLLFSDTFDSGDLSAWTLGSGWSLTPQTEGQALQVSNSNELVTLNRTDLSDAAVQADFLLSTGSIQVTLRQSVSGTYAVVVGADGQVSLYRDTTLLSSTTITLVSEDWNTLRLSAIDDVVRVAVNDVEVLALRDSQQALPNGTLAIGGIELGENSLSIDNVEVWVPLSILPEVTEEPLPSEPALDLYFSENFNGDTDPFSQILLAIWPLISINEGYALGVSESNQHARITSRNFTDVVVEANFQMNSGNGQLAVRRSKTTNGYTASLSNEGEVLLYRENTLLASATVPTFNANHWHTLRLSVIEDVLRVSIDGVEVIALRDAESLPLGMVTFAGDNLNGSQLLVDDLKMWIPATPESEVADLTANTAMSALSASSQEALLSTGNNPFQSNDMFVLSRIGDLKKIFAGSEENISLSTTAQVTSSSSLDISADGRKIAYRCQADICVIGSDGTGFRNLLNDSVSDRNPSWSPDGSQIAFRSDNRNGISGIWIINADGTNLRAVTSYGDRPQWIRTEDKDYIFFVNPPNGIYRLDLATGVQEQITNGEYDATPSLVVNEFDQVWLAYHKAIPNAECPYYDDIGGIAVRNLSINYPEMIHFNPKWPAANLEGVTPSCFDIVTDYDYRRPVLSPDATQVMYIHESQGRNESGNFFFAGYSFEFFEVEDLINGTSTAQQYDFISAAQFPTLGYDWGIKPATVPIEGRIVYISDRDEAGNDDVYVVYSNSETITRLTNTRNTDGGIPESAPALSPSGTRIAFVSERDGNKEIYTMRVTGEIDSVDGQAARRLTENPAVDDYPTWSPDGSRIAFVSDRDDVNGTGNLEIYVMNADGTNVQRLTTNPAVDRMPAWSADSSKIAFVSDRDGDDEIYILNVVTGDIVPPQPLTNNTASDQYPAWSPDNTKIAFSSDLDGDFDIYTMLSSDGTDVRQLTTTINQDLEPAWSPDGLQIAFTSNSVHMVDVNGTNEFVIITDGEQAAWSSQIQMRMRLVAINGVAVPEDLNELPANSDNTLTIYPYDNLTFLVEIFNVDPDSSLDNLTIVVPDMTKSSWQPPGKSFIFPNQNYSNITLPSGSICPDPAVTTSPPFANTKTMARWTFINLPSDGCFARLITLQPSHGGILSPTIEIYQNYDPDDGTPNSDPPAPIAIGSFSLPPVQITKINFDDPRLKSVMFWPIFNELSSDTYTSGNLNDVWLLFDSDATGYENSGNDFDLISHSQGYLASLASNPGDNPNLYYYSNNSISPLTTLISLFPAGSGFEGDLRSRFTINTSFAAYTATDFLRQPSACDYTADYPYNNLDSPSVFTSSREATLYLTHCNPSNISIPNQPPYDHRFLAAQTIINGFINYERVRAAQESFNPPASYVTIFGGSLGRDGAINNEMWEAYNQCEFDENDSWRTRAHITYLDAFMARENEYNTRDYNWEAPIDWLHGYLRCRVNQSNPAQRAVYWQAYLNIMREINGAIDQFHAIDLSSYRISYETFADIDIGSYVQVDPSNGAFFSKFSSESDDVSSTETVGYETRVNYQDGDFYTAFESVSIESIVTDYQLHISSQIYRYPASYNAVLRPILRLQRGCVPSLACPKEDEEETPTVERPDLRYYQYLGFVWATASYQLSGAYLINDNESITTEGDTRHYPR
jgi:Tol biopolymer transport system component